MTPFLSIIIPVLNERDNLQQLHQELTAALTRLKRPYEIIFVDDGSSDGSVSLCKGLVAADQHVVLVELRRHFGKATALQSGFEIARGEVIVTMDGDLQDDPAELPKFLDRINEGFDLVSGWKENRQDSFPRRLESKVFNFITSIFTGIALHDFNCGFKAYRREATRGLNLYGELYRYVPALAHAKGHRVGEVSVLHRRRLHGASKYSYERILRAPFDLFTTLFLIGFQRRPLHLFGPLGVLLGGIGLIINAWLVVLWFSGEPIGNRPLLVLGTLMVIVGIQVSSFGLLAEMIASATYRPSEVLGLVREVHRHGGQRDSHAA